MIRLQVFRLLGWAARGENGLSAAFGVGLRPGTREWASALRAMCTTKLVVGIAVAEQLTTSYRWFLARWAKRLSWQGTADAFNTTWDNVFRSVKHAVEWGLAHRTLSGIEAIGIDEVQWLSGHTYLTLVYQIDTVKRLLWVAEERTEKSLQGFFESLTAEVRTGIQFVASAMWSKLEPMKKVAKSLRRDNLGEPAAPTPHATAESGSETGVYISAQRAGEDVCR